MADKEDHRFHEVEVKNLSPVDGEVTIDGMKIKGLRDVSVDSPFELPTEVTITFIARMVNPAKVNKDDG